MPQKTPSPPRAFLGLALLVTAFMGLSSCGPKKPAQSTSPTASSGAAVSSSADVPAQPSPAQPSPAAPPATEAPTAPAKTVPAVTADGTPTGTPCLAGAPSVPKAPAPPLPMSGNLGLWVAEVNPQTLAVIKAVGTNPNSVFPLASTYKQAVLWALLREFDAGRISPTERFDVTTSNQSLGLYPFDGMTVRDLSTRMIQWSDNTATDILHRRVGLQKVQDVADGLGLCKTRFILPTRDWWVSAAGLSRTARTTPNWGETRGTTRAQLAAQIDHEARQYRADYIQRKLDYYFDHTYKPADDLKVHNLSTPYELGTLIAHEYLRPGLSPRAQKWQREVMAKGFGRYALKAQAANNVDYFGGKGGNGWRILTYSGYIQTRDGKRVVYAFMQHAPDETYTMPNTRRAFAWINAGIDAVIGEQKPKPPVKPLPIPNTPAAQAKAAAMKAAAQPLPKPKP